MKKFIAYRIHANRPPLLIKPPPIQNSNKPPLFCLKSPLFGAFLGENFGKISINLHLKILIFFYRPPVVYWHGYGNNSDPSALLSLSVILLSSVLMKYLDWVSQFILLLKGTEEVQNKFKCRFCRIWILLIKLSLKEWFSKRL